MSSMPLKGKRGIKNLSILRSLRSRSFLLLWTGQTISLLGDNVFTIALAWTVVELTGSATAMSLVMVAQLIPTIIFVLVGGVIADRLPRQSIMLVSDCLRGVIVVLVAISGWLHLLQFWQIVLMAFLFGIADSFFTPAYQSLIPQVVEKPVLSSANSLIALSRQMCQLLGPSLGALCLSLVGSALAFGIDGLSFFISASFLLVLRITLRIRSASLVAQQESIPADGDQKNDQPGIFAAVKEGLYYVKRSPWLWVTILLAALANIGYGGPMVIALPKLLRDVYHTGPWLLGIISTTTALGAIAGTLVIGQLQQHIKHRGALAYSALIISGLGLLAFGVPFPGWLRPWLACGASLFCGFSLATFQIIWTTLLQELVPLDKLGRVSSLDTLGSYCLLPVGLIIMGTLADRVGASWAFISGSAIVLCIAVFGLSLPDIRHLR